MIRTIALCTVTAVLTFFVTLALTGKGGGIGAAATANAPAFIPPCRQTSYGADGNMGPLFCVVDNPVALRYFAPMARHTFALGPDATPEEVTNALVADTKPGSGKRWKLGLPMLCSIYQLAAWKNQWHFAYSIDAAVSQRLNAIPDWCGDGELEAAEAVER